MRRLKPQALIAPEGAAWPDLGCLATTIDQWERSHSRKLPVDYTSFLTTYNGGRIYPSIFNVQQPPEVWGMSDFSTFLDPLYDWQHAAELWSGSTYLDGTPPGMFFLGCNPGGLEMLISLRPHDHGRIFSWWGSSVTWGEPGNNESNIYVQSSNFTNFIDQMYESENEQSLSYWDSPRHRALARLLKVG